MLHNVHCNADSEDAELRKICRRC